MMIARVNADDIADIVNELRYPTAFQSLRFSNEFLERSKKRALSISPRQYRGSDSPIEIDRRRDRFS